MGAPRFLTSAERPADIADAVDGGLHAHNLSHAPLGHVQSLVCAALDDEHRTLGGVIGRTWGECAEVEQVWVQEGHRRSGLGQTLMQHFEQEALRRGVRRIYLSTFSFQARGFYEKLGYQVVWEVPGFTPEISKFMMQRELPAPT